MNHQLHATLSEIQNSRNNWPPWLSKTLSSIKEQVATRRDQPTFQSYTQSNHSPQMSRRDSKTLPSFKEKSSSLLSENEYFKHLLNKEVLRRDSMSQKKITINPNRNSCEIKSNDIVTPLKDSASCNSLTMQ